MSGVVRARPYAERARRFREEMEALAARSRTLSNLRGLSFTIALVAGGFAPFRPEGQLLAGIAGLALGAFIVLLVVHGKVIRREEWARRLLWVNQAAELRVGEGFKTLPDDGSGFARDQHAYADDLDILGKGSLFQKLCVAHTMFGQRLLAEWLLKPSEHRVILERQEAVRALSNELELRQELEAESLVVSARDEKVVHKPPIDPTPFLSWASGPTGLLQQRYLSVLALALPLITIAAFIASRTLGLPHLVWLLPFALQVFVAVSKAGVTNQVFASVSVTEGAFVRYGRMLELLERAPQNSAAVKRLNRAVRVSGVSAAAAMHDFRNRLGWFDLKHNGLIHPFVNLALLWDIHCTLALERWQERHGRHLAGWFEAIGELEALSSFAGLLHDEPEFVFPKLDGGGHGFSAEELGHPLIAPEQRVVNDVSLPGKGSALLVTGSNMSGKSTLLRAMGVAIVLAQAGAPVCARRLELSEANLVTSMRVRDSLQAGVSHFYAELRKLKVVLDAAQAGPVFFLLDEILHGTNSKERQIGARWVMSELLRLGATGAVSTHDAELCQLPPDQMGRVRLVHLRESVENGEMTFDFKLREGPVTEGNALRLMRTVGLDVPVA